MLFAIFLVTILERDATPHEFLSQNLKITLIRRLDELQLLFGVLDKHLVPLKQVESHLPVKGQTHPVLPSSAERDGYHVRFGQEDRPVGQGKGAYGSENETRHGRVQDGTARREIIGR